MGDPILKRNLTRRVDFALFMDEPLENDELVHEGPAIVGRETAAARAHFGRDELCGAEMCELVARVDNIDEASMAPRFRVAHRFAYQ